MTTHSRFYVTDYRGKDFGQSNFRSSYAEPAGGIAAGQQTFVTVALGRDVAGNRRLSGAVHRSRFKPRGKRLASSRHSKYVAIYPDTSVVYIELV